MTNKLIITLLLSLFLTACGNPSKQEFNDYASEFYIQMFTDGEQSKEVKFLYEKIEKYKKYQDEKLYISLVNLYDSLENDPVNSAKYQVEIMNILNQ